MDAELPCLSIQPIIENAITHGVKLYIKNAEVAVSISAEEERIRVTVADNGVGMDAERLAELRKTALVKGGTGPGMGIRNVYERLSLYFGGDLDFCIDSRCGGGTVVSFDFPARSRSES
jgi:sensor histidine kinase YesM